MEIGFGTGEALLALARSVGTRGRVYGLDLSEGMRRRAQSRLRTAGLEDCVELKTGDATTLPFSSDSTDAVFISFTLDLIDTPEIPAVLDECRRVLRRGGRIGIVSMAKPEKSSWMVRCYEWAHRAFPVWIDCRPIRAHLYLANAGFEIMDRLDRSMWGLPVEILLAKKPD